uniref:PUM-HD domain-containing protein n=1 Tax=Parascaris univalens TaxID=6257 RepID=A0A915AZ66_PARUN
MVNLQKKSGKMKGAKRKRTLVVTKQKKRKSVDSKQTINEIKGKKVAVGDQGPAESRDNNRKLVLAERCKRQHSSSISSDGVISPKKKKKVSFAGELEGRKLFDQSTNKVKSVPSNASPGRSILSTKVKAVKKAKKNMKDSQNESHISEEKSAVMENKNADPTTKSTSLADRSKQRQLKKITGFDKTRKSNARNIQVTRKVKEKLMAMTRKERREFIKQLQRKRKPNFDLALQCKHLWEKIRSSKCNEEQREAYIHELYGLVKGKAKELIYAHDTCRVIECLTNLPKANIRTMVFDELTPEIVRMTKSKYARFFVIKMLRHGSPAERNIIINAFRGHCLKLMRISWAAEVLETAYNDYANALQRSNIICEFYGNEFLLFKADEEKTVTIKEIIEKEPAKKTSIMRCLEELLKDIVPKSQLKLSLTHRLLNEFLTHCSSEQMNEMVDSLKDRLPEIVHTNDGTRVALRCIWNGTVKERKVMVKNFKSLVVKTCLEEFGHRVLIAMFDTVDDTVLVNRYIIQEISNDIRTVALNRYGERVLHYLVNPRDRRYFGKGSLDIFKEGDNNAYSKKDANQRYAQLFAGIVKHLLTFIVANLNELLYDALTALLVLSVLEPRSDTDLFERTIDDEDRSACYAEIAKICAEEFVPCDTERLHPIEHPQAHFVISKLLRADSKFDVKLSDHLAKLGSEKLASWISCNKGCFILVHILENGSEEAKKIVTDAIPLSTLKGYSTKGSVALIKKLSGK